MVVIDLGEGIFKLYGVVYRVFLDLLKVIGKDIRDEIWISMNGCGCGGDKSDGIIVVIEGYNEVF